MRASYAGAAPKASGRTLSEVVPAAGESFRIAAGTPHCADGELEILGSPNPPSRLLPARTRRRSLRRPVRPLAGLHRRPRLHLIRKACTGMQERRRPRRNPQFTIKKMHLTTPLVLNGSGEGDSFVLYSCVGGRAELQLPSPTDILSASSSRRTTACSCPPSAGTTTSCPWRGTRSCSKPRTAGWSLTGTSTRTYPPACPDSHKISNHERSQHISGRRLRGMSKPLPLTTFSAEEESAQDWYPYPANPSCGLPRRDHRCGRNACGHRRGPRRHLRHGCHDIPRRHARIHQSRPVRPPSSR